MKRPKFCRICGGVFDATNAWHKYCSRKCETKSYRIRRGFSLDKERHCRQCGKPFLADFHKGGNAQHCSSECSLKSARESRSRFYDRNPQIFLKYRATAREKNGPDGNLKRFYARQPEATHSCESCGETRVLDIAHKPGHERKGRWRSSTNTKWPEMVWILCPTCHALLDRMNYPPSDLGLIPRLINPGAS